MSFMNIVDIEKGYVTISGYDYGSKPLEIVQQTLDTITIKILGDTHWVGLNMVRGYHEAEYVTYRVEKNIRHGNALSLEVTKIASIPVRAKGIAYRDIHKNVPTEWN